MSHSYALGDRLESFVQTQVTSGRYNDAGEVVRDALRLMEEREQRLASLDAALDQGLADIKAGRVYDLDLVYDELDAELAALPDARRS